MLKVYKRAKTINGRPIRIGSFKSYVAFADWLDQNRHKNRGTYDVIPSNMTSLASMDTVHYDGAICRAERRGNI